MPRTLLFYLFATVAWLTLCTTCMPIETRVGSVPPVPLAPGIRDNPGSFRSSYANRVVWYDPSDGSSGSYSGGGGGGYSFGK